MRNISTKKIIEIKKAGGNVEFGEVKASKNPEPERPAIEKSLEKLNSSVKNIKINDSAELVIKTVSGISNILLKTVETLESVKSPEKVKHWKVSVSSRDRHDRIKTLDLKAV